MNPSQRQQMTLEPSDQQQRPQHRRGTDQERGSPQEGRLQQTALESSERTERGAIYWHIIQFYTFV